MNRVIAAIESGQCVLAVSGSMLKDPEVMLALTERAGLPAMALSGPAVAPVLVRHLSSSRCEPLRGSRCFLETAF